MVGSSGPHHLPPPSGPSVKAMQWLLGSVQNELEAPMGKTNNGGKQGWAWFAERPRPGHHPILENSPNISPRQGHTHLSDGDLRPRAF